MASQDTEITLGTGKMLALFFGLVALNGAFFGMGYSLGRTSSHTSLSADQSQSVNVPAIRPSATKSGSAAANNGQQDTNNLTFYKTVEQKDASAQLPATKDSSTATDATSGAPVGAKPAEAKPADAAPDAATVLSTSNYFVQVAAVSKQDDAQALVDALKKKQYTAFATNTSPTDKLYHVQVGPFGDVKEAEATKAKLVSDGYNPILKK
jgi:cell division septation protein DedD